MDPDCGTPSGTPSFSLPVLIGAAVVLLVIAAGAVWYLRKGKKPQV